MDDLVGSVPEADLVGSIPVEEDLQVVDIGDVVICLIVRDALRV